MYFQKHLVCFEVVVGGLFFSNLGKTSKKKSRLLLDIVQKGGGGFNPNPKVLGYFFWDFLSDFFKKGGG